MASNALECLPLLSVQPREHHLAPLLESFCNAGQVPDAIRVLASIRATGIAPSLATVQPIVSVLSTIELVDTAFYALEDMHNAGDKLDISALNAIIEASVRLDDLARVRATQAAAESLDLVPNIDTFNLVLSGCISSQHRQLGDTVLGEMALAEIAPDSTTFERMIILCLTQPTYDDAFYYLDRMKAQNIKPSYSVYSALVRKCASVKDSRWKLAMEELESVGYKADSMLVDFIQGKSRPGVPSRLGSSGHKEQRRTDSQSTNEGQRRTRDQMVGEKRRQWLKE
jgi:pentatricopeptide repeat protein